MIVVAVNVPAESAGIHPGMTLADTRALEPAIRPVDADFTADARALDGLADWSGRYTPWVGLDAPDGIFLDITGCGHLFGGEAALLEDVAAGWTVSVMEPAPRSPIRPAPPGQWRAMVRSAAPSYGRGIAVRLWRDCRSRD